MTFSLLASLAVLGGFIGILAGLLGIGGGMVMIPFLIIALESVGFPPGQVIKVAIATSLCTILFTSVSSVLAHHRRQSVQWAIVKLLAVGIVVGTLLATQVVHRLPATWLTAGFALFMAYSALKMLKQSSRAGNEPIGSLPGTIGMFGAGSLIGAASAILGAGGGFLTIPFLTQRGVQIQHAIGTSAAAGFPIAAAGAVGYAMLTPSEPIDAVMLGYIYVPALLAIAIASITTAPMGAALAHRLPVASLRRVFAVLLLLLACALLWRAFG